jgi:hypothetical protein
MDYRFDSRVDYAKAYGYESPEAYELARASYEDKPDWGDGLGSSHHPDLCDSRCPCKTRPRGGTETGKITIVGVMFGIYSVRYGDEPQRYGVTRSEVDRYRSDPRYTVIDGR